MTKSSHVTAGESDDVLSRARICPVHATFDPLATAFLGDPFAVLASLPSESPVFYAPSIDYYVVTRYADIKSVFLDPETYSAAITQLPLVQLAPDAAQILLGSGHKPQPSMVSLDPPAHTRLRAPTARAFTPGRVTQMEPKVRLTIDQLLDDIDPSRPFDLVSGLTFPLPATIIFSFVGIPEHDWPQLKEWCGHRAALWVWTSHTRRTSPARCEHGLISTLSDHTRRHKSRPARR